MPSSAKFRPAVACDPSRLSACGAGRGSSGSLRQSQPRSGKSRPLLLKTSQALAQIGGREGLQEALFPVQAGSLCLELGFWMAAELMQLLAQCIMPANKQVQVC